MHDHRDVDGRSHTREEDAREGQPLGGQHVLQLVLWPLQRNNNKVRMSFLSWSSIEEDTKRAGRVCWSPLHRDRNTFAHLLMLPCSFKGIRQGRAA